VKFEKKHSFKDGIMKRLGFAIDFEDSVDRMPTIQKLYMILTDSDNVYNFIYLIVSLIALFEPILYAL